MVQSLSLFQLLTVAVVVGVASSYDHSLPHPVHTVTLQQHQHHHSAKRSPGRHHRRSLRDSPRGEELTPLYPGYGTHFAFLYVGTPPVRQAVIIDSGSSHTAFPCTGCSKCGKHLNPYFDPAHSTSASISKCRDGKQQGKCNINEHYSEGSSWAAFEVVDSVFVGGNEDGVVRAGQEYSVPFPFGCMTSVSGLFETQLADGIMALSRHPKTLPNQLKHNNVTVSSVFSICLETGNGILTLGGVDQSLHKKHEKVQYASLVPRSEFWSVEIAAIRLGDDKVNDDFSRINKGGALFDSGSTDSVFPTFIKTLFTQMIPEMNKLDKNNRFKCTRDLLKTAPPVIIDLVGVGGTSVDTKAVQLTLLPTQYLTKVDQNIYESSIYFDDSGGVILGANAMSGYNTIFDAEGGRVGFVPAKCRYEDYVFEDEMLTLPPTAAPRDGEATNAHKKCENSAYASCSAKCNHPSPRLPYAVNGTQLYDCDSEQTKPCVEFCSMSNQVQRGVSPLCLNSFWTECSDACSQTRVVAHVDKMGKCAHTQETRSCYIDQCPSLDGDILIFADSMFFYKSDTNEDRPWSKLYEEDIIQALSILFHIMPGNIDILVDPEASLTQAWAGTKLQLQIYLKLHDFKDSETKLYSKAESIRKMLHSVDIGSWIIAELSRICDQLDGDAISRYSFLFAFDFEVRRSVVLPIGEKRDPTEAQSSGSGDDQYRQQLLVYFLVGGILAIAVLAAVIIAVHYRLRADYALLAKDKVLSGGRMAKTIWNRIKKKRGGGGGGGAKGKEREESSASSSAEARGLMSTSIHDDDDDLNEFM